MYYTPENSYKHLGDTVLPWNYKIILYYFVDHTTLIYWFIPFYL